MVMWGCEHGGGGPQQFAWDDVPGSGSPEHYWHLLLGYLLPMVRELGAGRVAPTAARRLYDCGPVMNGVLVHALQDIVPGKICFSSSACITGSNAVARAIAAEDAGRINVDPVAARWDLWLMHGQHRETLRTILLDAGDRLRSAVQARACCAGDTAQGRFLVLRRSEEPAYYRADGPARNPSYGVGRRSLRNLEEGSADLEKLGLANMIYEPGAHNLACQIEHFSRCAGAIGVRGAEFANVVWMQPRAAVVMFQSSGYRSPAAPPRTLAEPLRLPFVELPHEGHVNPRLDACVVAEHLQRGNDA